MSEDDTEVTDAVAWMCAQLPDIREQLAETGDTAALERVVTALHAGTDPSQPLEELHTALQRSGDALGLYGQSRAAGGGDRPTGLGPARPAAAVFLCPRGSCSRTWWPDQQAAPTEPPHCAVHAQALNWARV